MLSFAPPKLSDRKAVLAITGESGFPGADVNFANLFLYQQKYKISICIQDGILFRRFGGTPFSYAFPISSGDPETALGKIEQDAAQNGLEPSFCILAEEQRKIIERLRPNRYCFELDRASSDYLYSRDSLAELNGREFHRKRNAIFRFRAQYPDCRLLPLTYDTISDALSVTKSWFAARKEGTLLPAALAEEQRLIETALEFFDQLGLTGGVLYADDKPAAMSIASQTCPGVYDIHFEKAVPDKQQAYSVICSETARFLADAQWINREEDMGIEGLRTAKLAWFPQRIILRYNAIPKGTS